MTEVSLETLPVVNRPPTHNFKIKSFSSFTFCDYCGQLLWGICAQGYQCVDCNFSSHSHCTGLVKSICKTTLTNTIARAHDFSKTSKSISKFCNLCRETTFTISGEPLCCKDCRYIVHSHCKEKAPNTCRIPYNTRNQYNHNDESDSDSDDEESRKNKNKNNNNNHIHYHHWVEGNLKESKKCVYCLESCDKSFSLANYKCLWCSKHLHSGCYDKHDPICDFGTLSEMIIPPYLIDLIEPESKGTNDHPNHLQWKLSGPIHSKTLFVFINSKSGGQLGSTLIRKFSSILNPIQIIDLIHHGPNYAMQVIKNYLQEYPNDTNKFRLLVCGGDGTVGWILQVIRKFDLPSIPIGIIPLGTGNDLARSLGWGMGYDNEKLTSILKKINDSKLIQLDTWQVEIKDHLNDENNKTITMNNYFSIGLDASIALGFHLARNANPGLFTGRTVNKLWYTKIGLEEFVTKNFVKLTKVTKIIVDGVEIKIDKGVEGIMILNLGSYAGGVDLWGKKRPKLLEKQFIDDQMMEIVGVTGLPHLGSCLGNLASPIKLAQGRDIVIHVDKSHVEKTCEFAFQVDGEPEPIESHIYTFHITFLKKVNMLYHKEFKPRVKQSKLEFDLSTVQVSTLSTATSPTTHNQTIDEITIPITKIQESDEDDSDTDTDQDQHTNFIDDNHEVVKKGEELD
ncbi:hypothetical protein CYY_005298 [Polysphondylium violaceum]|uniref:Diacylglycerol kinase n=1 Tax=Polysphondylium violaceum TaxID=133409 RepID=A0A8J4PUG7_9MYCE|nr:hypothetical protein CYY_005298 [Polysphondylium violaceum]